MSLSDASPGSHDPSGVSIDQPMFFAVSIKKLIVMSFLTNGFYWTYCLYRSWVLYRDASGERVIPLVRGVFDIFFIYSLLGRVDRQLRSSGRDYAWSPFWLVCILILLAVIGVWASLFFEQAILLFFGLLMVINVGRLWVLAKIQRAMNTCIGDDDGKSNARISPLNWAWITMGAAVWVWSLWDILLMCGTFMCAGYLT